MVANNSSTSHKRDVVVLPRFHHGVILSEIKSLAGMKTGAIWWDIQFLLGSNLGLRKQSQSLQPLLQPVNWNCTGHCTLVYKRYSMTDVGPWWKIQGEIKAEKLCGSPFLTRKKFRHETNANLKVHSRTQSFRSPLVILWFDFAWKNWINHSPLVGVTSNAIIFLHEHWLLKPSRSRNQSTKCMNLRDFHHVDVVWSGQALPPEVKRLHIIENIADRDGQEPIIGYY